MPRSLKSFVTFWREFFALVRWYYGTDFTNITVTHRYLCKTCNHIHERDYGFSDKHPAKIRCHCGGIAKRMIHQKPKA